MIVTLEMASRYACPQAIAAGKPPADGSSMYGCRGGVCMAWVWVDPDTETAMTERDFYYSSDPPPPDGLGLWQKANESAEKSIWVRPYGVRRRGRCGLVRGEV